MFCPIVVPGPLISWSMAKTATSCVTRCAAAFLPSSCQVVCSSFMGFCSFACQGVWAFRLTGFAVQGIRTGVAGTLGLGQSRVCGVKSQEPRVESGEFRR